MIPLCLNLAPTQFIDASTVESSRWLFNLPNLNFSKAKGKKCYNILVRPNLDLQKSVGINERSLDFKMRRGTQAGNQRKVRRTVMKKINQHQQEPF
jgi:hypothetical protein